LPKFGKRSVQTSIRLKDGQTNVLAGLIREDERWTKEMVFGVGDIPVVGSLFARNRREAQQTDVIIMLTPHIVRVLDMTEGDLRPFGVPREGSGAPGAPPPAPPAPGGRGGGGRR
jgi:general secretion pathway protein D